ncbi:MAG: enoyl-ACP reductase [Chlorobia bacterium]|nr:enoyl-ACP reductase [Fimbriimonadaceae bacterium]
MLLAGKKGLVLNVTNKNSIGWAIADLANQHGATVGIGAQNERLQEGVSKLVADRERFDPFLIDFLNEEEFDRLAEQVKKTYGKLDFIVHSVGYAPKEALTGRFIDTSLEDFQVAMNASAFSLVRLCRALEPLLNEDASVITLSYLGSSRVMYSYKVMGLAKAALESAVRYLAADLGERGIRVNTVSPGPVNTISARGVSGLTDFMKHVQDVAPLKREYGQSECAGTAVFLLSDLSKGITGQLIYVDSGYNTVAV